MMQLKKIHLSTKYPHHKPQCTAKYRHVFPFREVINIWWTLQKAPQETIHPCVCNCFKVFELSDAVLFTLRSIYFYALISCLIFSLERDKPHTVTLYCQMALSTSSNISSINSIIKANHSQWDFYPVVHCHSRLFNIHNVKLLSCKTVTPSRHYHVKPSCKCIAL